MTALMRAVLREDAAVGKKIDELEAPLARLPDRGFTPAPGGFNCRPRCKFIQRMNIAHYYNQF